VYCRIAADKSSASVDMHISKKKKRIGALCWRILKSQIRYSLENIQWAVALMAWCIFELWVVNANWNSDYGYWNVEANPIGNPYKWNDENQVLSC